MGIKYAVNKDFFKTWTNEMAYVLGFISADGNIIDAPYMRGKYLSIWSKDKEILEKIKLAMGSEHKIITRSPKVSLFYGKNMFLKKNMLSG